MWDKGGDDGLNHSLYCMSLLKSLQLPLQAAYRNMSMFTALPLKDFHDLLSPLSRLVSKAFLYKLF